VTTRFKDTVGRYWDLAITVSTVKRVRQLADVDLIKALEGELLVELASDPVALVDTLYAICKPQADAAGVSDEQFGEAMAGEAIDAACEAFIEALTRFFSRPGRREALRAMAAKVEATLALAETKAIEQVGKLDPATILEAASSPARSSA